MVEKSVFYQNMQVCSDIGALHFCEPLPCNCYSCETLGAQRSNFAWKLKPALRYAWNHWELLGTTGNHWELLGITRCYWEPLGTTGNQCVSARVSWTKMQHREWVGNRLLAMEVSQAGAADRPSLQWAGGWILNSSWSPLTRPELKPTGCPVGSAHC